MKVIVDLCVVPIGVGVHLAPTMGCPRTDKEQTLEDKVASVQALL